MQLFTVAGVSRNGTELKARFANSLDRARVLERVGHKDIALMELPIPMTKPTAAQWLLVNKFDCGDREIREVLGQEFTKEATARVRVLKVVKATPAPEGAEMTPAERQWHINFWRNNVLRNIHGVDILSV